MAAAFLDLMAASDLKTQSHEDTGGRDRVIGVIQRVPSSP